MALTECVGAWGCMVTKTYEHVGVRGLMGFSEGHETVCGRSISFLEMEKVSGKLWPCILVSRLGSTSVFPRIEAR